MATSHDHVKMRKIKSFKNNLFCSYEYVEYKYLKILNLKEHPIFKVMNYTLGYRVQLILLKSILEKGYFWGGTT